MVACLQVSGEKLLKIQFTNFSNNLPSRTIDSQCCSGILPFCNHSCQPHFELCYKGIASAGPCLQKQQTETFVVPDVISHTLTFDDTNGLFNFTFQDAFSVTTLYYC
jgi:hypothetical protein